VSIDGSGIYNFRRLSPTLTTSGQPTEEQFEQIAEAGVGTVINLAMPDSPHALPNEADLLAGLRVRYVPIPVDFAAPRESDYQRFAAEMDALGDAPLHVHCIANYRVAAFLYRYRRERLGWTEEEARPDLDAVWQPEGVWAEFISR
jgi:protein tyrosine phosphatase (PTP) superfamily phosphohydrolase (DUF442 family)